MIDQDLQRALDLPVGPGRTAALAAWLQRLMRDAAAAPAVLVGGAAIELYTDGGYVTGDLDFVGRVDAAADRLLRANGLERRGRHWVLEAAQLFIEFPAEELEPRSAAVELQTAAGAIRIISAEALLADRLAAWKFWRSTIDAANALLLLQCRGERMNGREAARCARELEVEDERRRLLRFARRLRGRRPGEAEFLRWQARGRR